MKIGRERFLWAIVGISLVLYFGMCGTVFARWVLYDNFNSGTIDNTKWEIDDSSATISIENGEAKFVHNSGFPNDSSWLFFRTPIKAMRATIRVESCTGDVLSRALGIKWLDEHGYQIIQMLPVDAFNNCLFYFCGAWDPVNLVVVYEMLNADFQRPIPIFNVDHTIEINFSGSLMYGAADGYGRILFEPENTLLPSPDPIFGIGTRSTNGDGPCTVFFDDVYVKY